MSLFSGDAGFLASLCVHCREAIVGWGMYHVLLKRFIEHHGAEKVSQTQHAMLRLLALYHVPACSAAYLLRFSKSATFGRSCLALFSSCGGCVQVLVLYAEDLKRGA